MNYTLFLISFTVKLGINYAAGPGGCNFGVGTFDSAALAGSAASVPGACGSTGVVPSGCCPVAAAVAALP